MRDDEVLAICIIQTSIRDDFLKIDQWIIATADHNEEIVEIVESSEKTFGFVSMRE